MNIGLFTDTYFPQINGVGTSTYTLAKQLRNLGHNVYIFTPKDPNATYGPYEEGVIRMPSMPFIFINSFRVGLFYSPAALVKIAHLDLDIIHTQTEFSLGTFGKIFSKTFGIPMVHTYHTMYQDYVHYIVNGALITTSMAHSFSRIFCNFAADVIAPTAKVKSSLLQYGVTKDINIIPTGIDINKFRASNYSENEIIKQKQALGIKDNNKIILFVGRIAKEKSIDTVLNQLPDVFAKDPKIKFLIVGDGPHKENLEHLVADLGISDNVIFAGAKPWAEIGKYYQLGDIFISASVSETQGLTFIEAMAAGLPVIAKNDPCIDGVIVDEENGVIFENHSDIGEKILSLLNDNTKYANLSKNAVKFAENLSEENFASKVEEVYNSVIKNGKHKVSSGARLYSLGGKIKRTAKYELIMIKRAQRKMQKIAFKPANAVKKYVLEKTNKTEDKNDI